MNREISSIGLPETSPFPEPEGLLGTLFMVTFCLFFGKKKLKNKNINKQFKI
jgi:hypothetical protein